MAASTLTAATDGTYYGWSDGTIIPAMGSLSPPTLGGNGISLIVTAPAFPGSFAVYSPAGTFNAYSGAKLIVDGVTYEQAACDDLGTFISQSYAAASFAGFVPGNTYSVDLVPPPVYAGPTFGAVGSAVGSAAATSVSVTSVRGVGRRMFIPVMTANQAVATPSGWQSFTADIGIPQRGTAGAAGGVRLTLWWKDSDGTETTVAIADSGDIQYGVPFSVVPSPGSTIGFDVSFAGNAASTSGVLEGLTTGADNCLVVGIVAIGRDATGATWSSPAYGSLANGSKRFDNGTSTGTGGGIAIFTGEKKTAGATGDITATQTGNIANAFMMIALKNVVGAPPSRDLPRSHFWL